MKKSTRNILIIGGVLLIIFLMYRGAYNKIVKLEEEVKASWANVESSYQRRADLIPNLVNTVKGYATHEQETFTQVTNARARATSINIDPANLNAANIAKFQQAQGELNSALSRLLVVAERYPDLKANQNFLELQAQLEGTENRINVARNNYNEAVKNYNAYIKGFIAHLLFSREEKSPYTAKEGSDVAPEVQF